MRDKLVHILIKGESNNIQGLGFITCRPCYEPISTHFILKAFQRKTVTANFFPLLKLPMWRIHYHLEESIVI